MVTIEDNALIKLLYHQKLKLLSYQLPPFPKLSATMTLKWKQLSLPDLPYMVAWWLEVSVLNYYYVLIL